jgi:D-amino peptidase
MRLLIPTLSLALAAGSAFAQAKVYISADMEGIGGVVTGEQLGTSGFEYQRFREFMTEEVLAAIRGAQAGGATEILVSDSHGNGQNLLIGKLPDDVQVVRSWPRPLGMMEGIDGTFDCVLFIGYHTSTSNPAGVRALTFSSATLTDVRLNSVSVSEAGFNAAVAGHFGVPIAMISGDDAIVAEAKRYIGEIEGAVVKHALSFHSARTLTPGAAQRLIEETGGGPSSGENRSVRSASMATSPSTSASRTTGRRKCSPTFPSSRGRTPTASVSWARTWSQSLNSSSSWMDTRRG